MTRPTPEQIATEADTLEAMKPGVRPFSFFGDDNRAAIDAQIAVLRDGMSETAIYEAHSDSGFDDEADNDGENQHALDNALAAHRWMTGEASDAPSTDWKDLLTPGFVPAPTRPRRLISSDEAVQAKCQHRTPCSDCPWARTALNGWLGGASIDDWLRTAHSDTHVDCHTLKGAQCAGIAIYRKNVVKRVEPPLLVLPADEVKVFGTPLEFRAHHEAMPGRRRQAANDSAPSRKRA